MVYEMDNNNEMVDLMWPSHNWLFTHYEHGSRYGYLLIVDSTCGTSSPHICSIIIIILRFMDIGSNTLHWWHAMWVIFIQMMIAQRV